MPPSGSISSEAHSMSNLIVNTGEHQQNKIYDSPVKHKGYTQHIVIQAKYP